VCHEKISSGPYVCHAWATQKPKKGTRTTRLAKIGRKLFAVTAMAANLLRRRRRYKRKVTYNTRTRICVWEQFTCHQYHLQRSLKGTQIDIVWWRHTSKTNEWRLSGTRNEEHFWCWLACKTKPGEWLRLTTYEKLGMGNFLNNFVQHSFLNAMVILGYGEGGRTFDVQSRSRELAVACSLNVKTTWVQTTGCVNNNFMKNINKTIRDYNTILAYTYCN